MDLSQTCMQIGIVETCACVERHAGVGGPGTVGQFLPVSTPSQREALLGAAADHLLGSEYDSLFLLSPELAFLDLLAEKGADKKLFVALSRHLDDDAAGRVARNVPPGVDVTFVAEGAYPHPFDPARSAIVAFGYGDTRTACLPAFEQSMLSSYGATFPGDVVLVCIAPPDQGERPLGWLSRNAFGTFDSIVY